MNKLSEKGFTLVEGLLVVVAVLLFGFGGYYVWNQNQASEGNSYDSPNTSEQESAAKDVTSEDETIVLSSKLYPEVEFMAYEGWSLAELDEYDSGVSSTLSLIKGNAKVDLMFNTSADRGVLWPECFVEDTDVPLDPQLPSTVSDKGVFSRYENQGKYSYGFVDNDVTSYKELLEVGDISISDASFCATNGIIATVDSTVSRAELPQSHDKNNNDLIDAWLEDISTNTHNIEESVLLEMDAIMKDFIESAYGTGS